MLELGYELRLVLNELKRKKGRLESIQKIHNYVVVVYYQHS